MVRPCSRATSSTTWQNPGVRKKPSRQGAAREAGAPCARCPRALAPREPSAFSDMRCAAAIGSPKQPQVPSSCRLPSASAAKKLVCKPASGEDKAKKRARLSAFRDLAAAVVHQHLEREGTEAAGAQGGAGAAGPAGLVHGLFSLKLLQARAILQARGRERSDSDPDRDS